MSEELKPCPFCGHTEELTIVRINDSAEYWCIGCENCDYNQFISGTKEEAVKSWNTRPIEDEKDKVIARLKGNWDYLKKYLVTLRNSRLRNVCFDDSELNRYAITFLNDLIEKIYDTDNNVGSMEE